MNADAFRHLYEYHFTANRKIWEQLILPLTDEEFTRKSDYSVGSVRNQVVHLLNIDDRWFSGLRGLEVPGFLNPEHFHERAAIRERWDGVEAGMRVYLRELRDDMLNDQPFLGAHNDSISLWQVLLHVANHGTDHRAQLLAQLHSLGKSSFPQDYVFFIYGKL